MENNYKAKPYLLYKMSLIILSEISLIFVYRKFVRIEKAHPV